MKNYVAAELLPGTTIDSTFLVQFKERRTDQSGTSYLALTLQDSSGTIKARCPQGDEALPEFEIDDIVEVKATVEERDGVRRLLLHHVAKLPAEDAALISLADYLPCAAQDVEALYESLICRVERMAEGFVKALVLAVLKDPLIARAYIYAR